MWRPKSCARPVEPSLAVLELYSGDFDGASAQALSVLDNFPHPSATAFKVAGVAKLVLKQDAEAVALFERLKEVEAPTSVLALADLATSSRPPERRSRDSHEWRCGRSSGRRGARSGTSRRLTLAARTKPRRRSRLRRGRRHRTAWPRGSPQRGFWHGPGNRPRRTRSR